MNLPLGSPVSQESGVRGASTASTARSERFPGKARGPTGHKEGPWPLRSSINHQPSLQVSAQVHPVQHIHPDAFLLLQIQQQPPARRPLQLVGPQLQDRRTEAALATTCGAVAGGSTWRAGSSQPSGRAGRAGDAYGCITLLVISHFMSLFSLRFE